MPIYQHEKNVPQLGKDVFVAPNAVVIGDVVLGDEASVWFGVTIRGDVFPIRIGARTNIQDGSVIHVTNDRSATTIGDDVTVGHMALLHGCTIGHRVLVGMGSIVLDDATVGDDAIIGAGSLVPPRMKIPPRVLVMGRPAKIIRELKDEDLVWTRAAGQLYVQYARTFMSDSVRKIRD